VSKQPTGVGSLFSEDSETRFKRLTKSRYTALSQRLKKKGVPETPFDLNEYQEFVLKGLGGLYDGFLRCRYCQGFYSIAEIVADHEVPLGKGGSPGLENMALTCSSCNNEKGQLRPEDYVKLKKFLEDELPMARQDVLGRLAKAVSLAQGMRSNAAVIEDLKRQGIWQQTQKRRREEKKAKGSGLGKF
jgi:5-methylcytosine-specific restriction endonuclease McrA